MSDINEAYDKLLEKADLTNRDESYKLTDEDLKDIQNTMNEIVENDSILDTISKLPSNNGVSESKGENELDETESEVIVQVNPVTGEHVITGTEVKETSEEDQDLITTTFEELWDGARESDKIEDIKLTDDIIKNGIEEQFGMNPFEATMFLNLVKSYQDGNTSNLFSRLPSSMQAIINKNAMESENIPIKMLKNAKNVMAKEIIEEFISDMSYDKIVVDFNNEMNNIFAEATDGIKKMYSEIIIERETQLKYMYNKVKDSDPEKAEQILTLQNTIEESYTYNKFKETLQKIKVKKFELEKPEKIYNEFNYKYENSVYNIHSIALLEPILTRIFKDKFDQDKIIKFIICFCKYTMNMSPSNVIDHAYMYYFVSNIIYLNTINVSKEDEFETKLLNNIESCLELL